MRAPIAETYTTTCRAPIKPWIIQKKELNTIYQKLYSSTQYKNEFEQSQRAWLNYRDKQCNGYIAAEASQSQGAGPGLITKDCLATITKQRVDYLKTLLVK
ncbi:lysozyme inhibitor LprI family protein [Burkholderia sp. 567]|uniref:lysozyme inhibitor LprI family protein n=1 Tax=Burkholderia sp. 567 TaxID=3156413 RepID=UPI0033923632